MYENLDAVLQQKLSDVRLVVTDVDGVHTDDKVLLGIDEEEIEENWKNIIKRKTILDDSLKTGNPPTPFQYCFDWECKNCRFKLICETLVSSLGLPDVRLEKDKTLWS